MIRPSPRFTLLPCPPLFRSEVPQVDPVSKLEVSPPGADEPDLSPPRRAETLLPSQEGGTSKATRREGLWLPVRKLPAARNLLDRKSTRLNSSHLVISYAVFC